MDGPPPELGSAAPAGVGSTANAPSTTIVGAAPSPRAGGAAAAGFGTAAGAAADAALSLVGGAAQKPTMSTPPKEPVAPTPIGADVSSAPAAPLPVTASQTMRLFTSPHGSAPRMSPSPSTAPSPSPLGGTFGGGFGETFALRPDSMSAAQQLKRRKTALQRCGSCEPCLRDDCGTCVPCLDLPKFGGHGKRKESCAKRRCVSRCFSPVDSLESDACPPSMVPFAGRPVDVGATCKPLPTTATAATPCVTLGDDRMAAEDSACASEPDEVAHLPEDVTRLATSTVQ